MVTLQPSLGQLKWLDSFFLTFSTNVTFVRSLIRMIHDMNLQLFPIKGNEIANFAWHVLVFFLEFDLKHNRTVLMMTVHILRKVSYNYEYFQIIFCSN